jgi:hypothetical protein
MLVIVASSGIAPIFEPDEGSLSPAGEVAEILISLVAVTLRSLVIGLSALMSLSSNLPEQLGVVDSVPRGIVAVGVVIPLLVVACCVPLGAAFAALEGWDVRTGFEFIVSSVRRADAFLVSVITAPLNVVSLKHTVTAALGSSLRPFPPRCLFRRLRELFDANAINVFFGCACVWLCLRSCAG